MSKSKIEWTDETWNPVTGCTKVSQGCKNCYAERLYERFNGHGSFKEVICHEDRLILPLRWKKPRMVFVNSMSDLFHESVPFVFINAVFSVMSDISQHTYQVLTKRPLRALEFFEWKVAQFGVPYFPSSNVWIGVSVEDQKTADERIPLLCRVPAAVRFLSCEPLLGPIDFYKTSESMWNGFVHPWRNRPILHGIHWLIAGGESGPAARPMHPDWVRSLRDQCAEAGNAFFFKQWGEFIPACQVDHLSPFIDVPAKSRRQFPSPHNPAKTNTYFKIGKVAAGRLLDGLRYDAMPYKQS